MSTASETVEWNRFSEAFGYSKDSVVGKLKPYLTKYVQKYVKHSPFVNHCAPSATFSTWTILGIQSSAAWAITT